MQAGFSALDIVFLIILAIFIVTRFMGNSLPKEDKKKQKDKKVIKFPSEVMTQEEVETIQKQTKPAEPLKNLEGLEGIDLIKKADRDFSEKDFLSGAELAYQMYYDAMNEVDEETLENMIAPRKFDEIMESIETLESENKKRFVLIDKFKDIEIIDAKLHGRTAILDVKYSVLQTDVIEDIDKDIDSIKKAPKEVSTVWTWAKSIDSDDLNWELETMALLS